MHFWQCRINQEACWNCDNLSFVSNQKVMVSYERTSISVSPLVPGHNLFPYTSFFNACVKFSLRFWQCRINQNCMTGCRGQAVCETVTLHCILIIQYESKWPNLSGYSNNMEQHGSSLLGMINILWCLDNAVKEFMNKCPIVKCMSEKWQLLYLLLHQCLNIMKFHLLL